MVAFSLLWDFDVDDILFFLLQKLVDSELIVSLGQLFFDGGDSLPRHLLVG